MEPDETGFQVIFASQPYPDDPGTATFEDFPSLSVSGVGVTGFVGETAKGGAAENGGYQRIPTAQQRADAKAPANKTIPIRTPFTLKGSAKDAERRQADLLWEQIDWGNRAIALTSNTKKFGPLFRVFGEAALVTKQGTLQSPSPGLNLAGRNGVAHVPGHGADPEGQHQRQDRQVPGGAAPQ